MIKYRSVNYATLLAVIILTTAIALPGWSSAQTVKFPTKPITFIVPTRPGGGMDTYVRLVVPLLKKYLGTSNIMIKNMPGAEHSVGITAALKSNPDGHTFVEMLIPGANLNQVLGLAKYDLYEAQWLGALTRVPNICMISAKRTERTLKELQEVSKREELKSATAGLGTPAGAGAVIAAEVLGIKTNFIPHQGSAQGVLATLRGDSDYIVQGYATLKSATENKELIPLWVYSDTRYGHLPDVPTIVELGYPELVAPFDMYYAVAAPNKVPPEILSILRDAFKKAVEDPEYVKAMQKAGSYAIYTTPEGMSTALKKANDIYTKYKDVLLKYR